MKQVSRFSKQPFLSLSDTSIDLMRVDVIKVKALAFGKRLAAQSKFSFVYPGKGVTWCLLKTFSVRTGADFGLLIVARFLFSLISRSCTCSKVLKFRGGGCVSDLCTF